MAIIQLIPNSKQKDIKKNTNRNIVIGICGRNGSGKSTIAKMLVEKMGFVEYSFADKLKKMISELSGFSYQFLTDPKNRNDRETIKDTITGLTSRELMQKIGTAFRKSVSEDFWVKQLKNNIDESQKKIVISDCRYKNEIDYVMSLPNSYLLAIFNDKTQYLVSTKEKEEQHDSVYSFVECVRQLETDEQTKNRVFVVFNKLGQLQETLTHVSCLCDIFM